MGEGSDFVTYMRCTAILERNKPCGAVREVVARAAGNMVSVAASKYAL